jgi:hypothetical protein
LEQRNSIGILEENGIPLIQRRCEIQSRKIACCGEIDTKGILVSSSIKNDLKIIKI